MNNNQIETITTEELKALRLVASSAKRFMDSEPPCHCGELAPGPCCYSCRIERELRQSLIELENITLTD